MIKVRALEKNEFKDILINPDHIVAILPIFIPGEIVGGPTKEKIMAIMNTGQQFVLDSTIDNFHIGLNDENE